MTVAEISRKYKVTQNRIWRTIDHHVSKELEKQNFSKEPIKNLSVDEVARKKKHVYLTNFVDLEREKVVYIADGKDSKTFESFKTAYIGKQGKIKDIKTVCMDMSIPFQAGAKEHFPKAEIIFDKFHIIKMINAQLDKIRRRDNYSYNELLKRTKYLFLKNPNNLTEKQAQKLNELMEFGHLDTIKAYSSILEFKKIFGFKKPSFAGKFFKRWFDKAISFNIPELTKVANSLLNNLKGIINHIKTNLTNAKIEGMNSKIRGFTKRAFGFKSFHYLRLTIFMSLGKLSLS